MTAAVGTARCCSVDSLSFVLGFIVIYLRKIKKYRKEKGITSAQLAEMVGLSHDFIRQIESEKTRYNFSVETLYKISVALDVSLDKFVE